MDPATASLTQRLACFAIDRTHDRLPDAVGHAVRRSLLDFVSVAIAGTKHPAFGKLLQTLDWFGVSGPCSILGSHRRADAVNAALANGVAAHVHDWDDTILPARIHLSATLFPALLAGSEAHGWKLADIIPAFAIGFELQTRISRAIYPAIHTRRWHSTSLVASVGTAAACARLLGCDVGQTSHALGIAANAAGGLMSSFGTMTKALNVGRAGAWGLQSAVLASFGYEAHPDTIGAGGFLGRFDDAPREAELLDGLGDDWAILRNGFKLYPCGFVAHAMIDAVRELREAAGDAKPLERLELTVAPEAVQLMGRGVPRHELDAKFSLLYCAAVAWVMGHVAPAAFQDAAIHDPRVAQVMSLTVVTASTEIAQQAARAVAVFADGTRATATITGARGTADQPLTDDDLIAKFGAARAMAGLTPSEELAQRLLSTDDLVASDILGMATELRRQ